MRNDINFTVVGSGNDFTKQRQRRIRTSMPVATLKSENHRGSTYFIRNRCDFYQLLPIDIQIERQLGGFSLIPATLGHRPSDHTFTSKPSSTSLPMS